MNQTDGRWTIKVPAETRADILRLAHAADLTVAEWLLAAVRAARAAEPTPAFVGELQLVPGFLVRHVTGGPTMVAVGPEVDAPSPYPGMGDGGPTGRWICEWFTKGKAQSGAFWPVALEPAPA